MEVVIGLFVFNKFGAKFVNAVIYALDVALEVTILLFLVEEESLSAIVCVGRTSSTTPVTLAVTPGMIIRSTSF